MSENQKTYPHQRLGVNIDHVATLRNARNGDNPCPIKAAIAAVAAGADGITAHLREDRRHIRDEDIYRLKDEVAAPLNMEMAATDEMLKIALDVIPNACCLVPEKREELTTEGGLDVVRNLSKLTDFSAALREKNIRISLFIDPEPLQLEAAKNASIDIVEIHTGGYADAKSESSGKIELERIVKAAKIAEDLGIECHAGHGLNYDNVSDISAIKNIVELNIGHFLIGQSVIDGLDNVVKHFLELMKNARTA